MPHSLHPTARYWDAPLEDLKPVNGYCIMADIVGSTELKEKSVKEWVKRIAYTFNQVRSWVEPNYLKTVGDMLMFWFKDEQFLKNNSPLMLIDSLASMFRQTKRESEYFQPLRVAVCHCISVFEISFIRSGLDVYGRDIDITARLLELAGEGEVVMNEPFQKILSETYAKCGNKNEFRCVEKIQGPWSQDLNGLTTPITIYKLPSSSH